MIVSDDRVVKFVSNKLGVGFCPPWSAMGLEHDGEVVAGAIFNCFEGADVHISVAGRGWTRAFLRAVGDYAYKGLGCERVTFVTESTDVVALAERLGGQIEGKLRSHFGKGRDAVIVGVLRNEWRYATPQSIRRD